MVAGESALIFVLPQDDVGSIIAKMRNSGATTVQLLVPDGTAVLQDQQSIEQLQRSAQSNGIELLVISSDEKILQAAQTGDIATVGVSGTRVTHPDVQPAVDNGGTHPLDEEFAQGFDNKPAPAAPPRSDAMGPDDDDDIFAALNGLSETMNNAPPRDARSEDYDAFAAELDSLSDFGTDPAQAEQQARPEGYDAFAAELDDWGDMTAGTDHPAAPTAAPRQRVRPEDIELTDAEKQRASGTGRNTRAPRREQAWEPYPSRSRRTAFDGDQETTAPRKRRSGLRFLLPIILILLLGVIIYMLLFGGNATEGAERSNPIAGAVPFANPATVVVQLPAVATDDQAFPSQSIFINEPGSDESDTAVKAAPISVAAEYRVSGQVTDETQAPASTASGTITLYNQNAQAVTIPQGTEFIAINSQGQEVRFRSDSAVTLPGATTARQGPQIITTLGQEQVNVTALAPGSASNVEGGTISQMIIPGQGPIAVTAGALFVEHGPIGGGSEETVRILRNEDVQAVLSEALTGLDNQARQMLTSEASNRGLMLEDTTISPPRNAIFEAESYQIQVVPAIGETVDSANPSFDVTVRATFNALATPQGESLQDQLQTIVSNQLAQSDLVIDGTAPGITGWQWDGSRLTVDGVLRPTGEDNGLDAGTRAEILDAVKGKSLGEAAGALDSFVAAGDISGYTLPDVETIPRWSFLLNLEIEPANVQAEE